MTRIAVASPAPCVFEMPCVTGSLTVGDMVKAGVGGVLVRTTNRDECVGVVTQTGSSSCLVQGVDYDFKLDISPDGTIKVWDEVDLETGYGGRV